MLPKRLVFTLTPGRTGTMYLANALNTVQGVYAEHEPEPNFVDIMRSSVNYPPLGVAWWRDVKLPYLSELTCDIYVETSHLFVCGFASQLVQCGVVPDVIILRRPLRDAALSRWRKRSIPARSRMGQLYLLKPNDKGTILRIDDWHDLTDYQLCYWYCLEVEARTRLDALMVSSRGGLVVDTTMRDITSTEGFLYLLRQLCIAPVLSDRYEEICAIKMNACRDSDYTAFPEDLLGQEQAVVEKIRW